jgi:hypothetical protein
MNDKQKHPPLTAYRIIGHDGFTYETNCAANITQKDAEDYFLGKYLPKFGGAREEVPHNPEHWFTVVKVEQITGPATV